jgi:hypothetical protein
MKKYIIILMVVVLTCCAHQQKIVTKTSQETERAYIASLRSDIEGVVQSAIFQLMYKQMNTSKRLSNNILSEFISLKQNSNSKEIRRISGIAIEFDNQYDWELQVELRTRFLDQEKYFDLISDLLQEKHNDLEIESIAKE